MLAAVLWLGNISFQATDNENHVEVLADEGKIFSVKKSLARYGTHDASSWVMLEYCSIHIIYC